MGFFRYLLLLFALSCSNLFAADKTADQKIAIQLSWKFQFEFAPFIVALEKGYYREAGLNVELREWSPGKDVVEDVISGKAQYGVLASSLVVERAQGKPVVAIASLMQHSAVALLAKRNAGIESVHDLAGKRVATTHDTEDEIHAYLAASGLKREKYTTLPNIGFGVDVLHADKADAIAIYSSNEGFELLGKENAYLLLSPRSAGVDLFGNILFTSEMEISDHPARMSAVREATLKGLQYSLANPQEVADLIIQHYNSQNKTREHLLFEARHIQELTRPDIVEPGYMSRGRWRHVADIYADQGKIPKNFDLKGFLYDPTPRTLPRFLTWTLLGMLTALLIVSFIAWQFRRLSKQLKLEISERTAIENALIIAKNAAESANRAKSEFLANMSHEIRTPMNGIIGMTQLALEEEKDSKQHERLEKAHSAAVSLLGILNDVLDFSKIEAGKLELDHVYFDLTETLKQLKSLFETSAHAKGLQFSTHIEADVKIHLRGDPLRLAQILNNLVSNALKFTRQGEVRVFVRTAKQDTDQDGYRLYFEVRDTGIGISAEQCLRIFDAFEQADTSISRRFGGSGLGLAISQRLSRLMGGELVVESIEGQGSCFYFTARFEIAEPVEANNPPLAQKPGKDDLQGMHVLLVEDNRLNQQVATSFLKKAGVTVSIANDGSEGLNALLEHPAQFDAVLMDIQMPIMDGLTATKRIRELPQFDHLPIIAMTAHAMADDRQKCLDAGMQDYLSKPIDVRQLYSVLSQARLPKN